MIAVALLALGGTATYGWLNPAPGLFVQKETITIELEAFDPGIEWVEAVPSWNVSNAKNASLTVEARVVYPDRATKYYSFGHWTLGMGMGTRASVGGQKDADGTVLTDTLRMTRPGGKLQFRLTGRAWPGAPLPTLERLFVNFSDRSEATDAATNRPAWGTCLEPPQLAQGDFPNGKVLCSPACVSMVLGYWAAKDSKPDWALGVNGIESAVFDPVYNGAGNWSYNVGLAGSLPGMIAYTARLNDLGELEAWIERGVPIVCSVSWYLLHGEPLKDDEKGHLIVLVGFTAEGDPIFNDPGKRGEVRKTYPRRDFRAAWEYSKRTAYVIYPESHLAGFPGVKL